MYQERKEKSFSTRLISQPTPLYSYNCMIFHTKVVSFNSDILQHIREGNTEEKK